jgi:hypothetical protein
VSIEAICIKQLEISKQGEGDGTTCTVVNLLGLSLLSNQIRKISAQEVKFLGNKPLDSCFDSDFLTLTLTSLPLFLYYLHMEFFTIFKL